jgi:hypothetical protein
MARKAPPKTRKPAKPRDDRDPATGKFLPGKSGNPKGTPPGTRRNPFQGAATKLVTDEVAQQAVQVLVARMVNGDTRAAALVFGLVPKPRWPLFTSIKIASAEDAAAAMARITAGAIKGDLAGEDTAPALTALAMTASALASASDLAKLREEIAQLRRQVERQRDGAGVDGADAPRLPWETNPNGHDRQPE